MISLTDATALGVPIATKKLVMKEEFLMSAEDLYSTLTDEQVQFVDPGPNPEGLQGLCNSSELRQSKTDFHMSNVLNKKDFFLYYVIPQCHTPPS